MILAYANFNANFGRTIMETKPEFREPTVNIAGNNGVAEENEWHWDATRRTIWRKLLWFTRW